MIYSKKTILIWLTGEIIMGNISEGIVHEVKKVICGKDYVIAQMLTAILLLFSACSVFIQKWLSNRELRKKTQGGQKDE